MSHSFLQTIQFLISDIFASEMATNLFCIKQKEHIVAKMGEAKTQIYVSGKLN
jgi:hypothetical protein